MTNLEWLHSLSVDEVLSFFGGYTSKCHMCGYKDTCTDNTAKCYRFPMGLNIWLMQEHKDVPKVKPCPFCGSESVYILSKDGYNDKTAIIFCNACKSVVFIEDNEGEGFDDKTVARAIEAWNRRANDEN